MLSACNHNNRHRHRHDHHHRHHNSFHVNNSTGHPVNGTNNSLLEAMNTTSCLNMTRLKASLSHNDSLRKSETSEGSFDNQGGSNQQGVVGAKSCSRAAAHQSQVSVYSSGAHADLDAAAAQSRTNLSIESDDGETSYSEIKTEIQQALNLMSQNNNHRNPRIQNEETSSLHRKLLDQFILKTKKLDRSKSLFFTLKRTNSTNRKCGNGLSNGTTDRSKKTSKKKWSEKLTSKKASTSFLPSKRCNGFRHGPNQKELKDLEHSF